MRERHAKVFWVDEQTIFFLFVEFTKSPTEFVSIPTPINLPEGAVVEYCRHDPMRRGFAFVVSHPLFPIWEDGCECPRGQDVLEFTTTRRMCVQESSGKRLAHDAMVSAERDGISYEEAMRRITGYPEPCAIGVDPGHPEGDSTVRCATAPDGGVVDLDEPKRSLAVQRNTRVEFSREPKPFPVASTSADAIPPAIIDDHQPADEHAAMMEWFKK